MNKKVKIQFRCSVYQRKLLKIKARRAGLTLSEFCLRATFDKTIKERLSEDHIEIYKTLIRYHNNFKWIGNMFRKKDPRLTNHVYEIAEIIKSHLKRLRQ